MKKNRRAFISYSHDSEAHKEWVRGLGTFLRAKGVDALLDQWEVELGDDLPSFMERGIRDTDRVLMICTDEYVRRANDGSGGVGYEKTIATAEILRDHKNRRKFIPVVRNVVGAEKIPTFVGGALYIDLSDGKDNDEQREELLRRLHEVPISKPPLGPSPFLPTTAPDAPKQAENEESEFPSLGGKSRIVEFSDRFSQAFPGLRGVEWIDDSNTIAERLEILLKEPLQFKEGHLVGWWRGSENLHIDRFEHVEGSHFQMDLDELNIRRIAAASAGSYYQKWIYIEAAADQPTGLYPASEADIRRQTATFGYANEEYGLVDDKLPVTRAEYDDGAAIIEGHPVDILGRAKLRCRYITPYNFVIAPFESPINNKRFDVQFKAFLDDLLLERDVFDQMSEVISRLPKRN